MEARSTPHAKQKPGTLTQPTKAEQLAAMRLWNRVESGMADERGGMPEKPDDPVAYQLLDAAGQAIGRDEKQKGVNILRLVTRDYPQSREAAFARTVIDRLAVKEPARGR